MCEPFFFFTLYVAKCFADIFFSSSFPHLEGVFSQSLFFFHFDHLKEMGLSVVKEHGGWVLSSRCMVYVESVTASALAS